MVSGEQWSRSSSRSEVVLTKCYDISPRGGAELRQGSGPAPARPFCYHLHLDFSAPRLLLTDTQSDTNCYLLLHPVDRGGIKNKNIDIKLVQTCSIWYTSECWPDFTAPTFIINQISLASATEQSLSLHQHQKQNIFSRIWNTEWKF